MSQVINDECLGRRILAPHDDLRDRSFTATVYLCSFALQTLNDSADRAYRRGLWHAEMPMGTLVDAQNARPLGIHWLLALAFDLSGGLSQPSDSSRSDSGQRSRSTGTLNPRVRPASHQRTRLDLAASRSSGSISCLQRCLCEGGNYAPIYCLHFSPKAKC